jgi:hypothetical protein
LECVHEKRPAGRFLLWGLAFWGCWVLGLLCAKKFTRARLLSRPRRSVFGRLQTVFDAKVKGQSVALTPQGLDVQVLPLM